MCNWCVSSKFVATANIWRTQIKKPSQVKKLELTNDPILPQRPKRIISEAALTDLTKDQQLMLVFDQNFQKKDILEPKQIYIYTINLTKGG